jgi:hypothetical protein
VRHERAWSGVALLGVIVSAGGCGASPDLVPWSVTDSAGVSIVMSSAPEWVGEPQLSDAPRVQILSDESDPSGILYQVVGVELLADGRILLANRGDGSVRLYDGAGQLEWKTGGRGDGPGEFRDLRGMEVVGDEIWAYQSLPRPIHVFALDGAYLRSVASAYSSGPRIRGILSDGSIVAITGQRGSSTQPIFRQVADLVVVWEGVVDTIATLDQAQFVNTSLGPDFQALGPLLSAAGGGSRIYAGFGDEYDISVWDRSGNLIRRMRRAWDPVRVEASHREAYGQALMAEGEGGPQFQEAYRRLAEEMIYPESHPAFTGILVEASGGIWVERPQTQPPWSEAMDYSPVRPHPSEWDVFSPDGVWLGTIRLPARFRLTSVGRDRVAGVAKDEFDVERVEVWDLHRPT